MEEKIDEFLAIWFVHIKQLSSILPKLLEAQGDSLWQKSSC